MAYSEYSTRFFFRFASDAGREFRIDIKKRGYTGAAEQRPLGQTPVLKMENGNSGIFGTSLEIFAECRVDAEFAELYTSDPKEYLVVLSQVSGSTTTVIWRGYVTPELYSEPEVAPPYDVQIVATDGLGELKLYDFSAVGRQSLYTHLGALLAYTGLTAEQSDIVVVDTLECTTPAVAATNLLTGIYVNLDHFADDGANCYDVLSSILTTLGMSITRYGDKWLLFRGADMAADGSAIAGRTVGGTSVPLPVVQYGSMRNYRWYPVGRMETDVEPAKNAISVAYPFRMSESMLANPNLPDGSGWMYSQGVTWIQIAGEKRPGINAGQSIYQDIYVEKFDGELTLRLLTADFLNEAMTFGSKYRVWVKVKLTSTAGNYWYKDGDAPSWETSENANKYDETKIIGPSSSTELSIGAFSEHEFALPGIPASGTLRVEIYAKPALTSSAFFIIGGVYLNQATIPGYRDDVVINNGARGSAPDVTICFGDAPYSENALTNLRNVLTGNSVLTSEWATARFEGEFLSVVAMERAMELALPRLKARGTLNVPAEAPIPAAIINPDGVPMLVQTYGWKLKTDDLDIELISVPDAQLEIASQTIREMTGEEAATAAGGSGSTPSGGSSGGGPVTPAPQYFEPVDSETTGDTIGVKALHDIYIIQEAADEEQGTPEVTKDITEILRHLALQVIGEGTEEEETILVTDLTLASTKNLIAGGIGGGSEPGGGGSLATLADVALGTLAAGDILRYNATTSHWENVQPSLAMLTDVDLGTPTDGQALIWDATLGKWRPGTVASTGGIASVGLTMPTGFAVAGSPLTSDGTLQVSFASGYALPTTADVTKGTTAYGWGNHANAGYLTTATADGRYAAGFNFASGKLYLVDKNGTALTNISGDNLATAIGTAAVNRATNDANGNTIASQTWVTTRGYLTSVAFGDLTSHPTTLSGYGITDAKISGGTITLGGNTITPLASVAFADLTSHPTTLSGYGITDAKISGGTITLGANTLTPLTEVSVVSGDNTIGTSLTTIGQVQGVNIRAKIAAYLLAADFTAANIVNTLGTTPVNRATADASGNTITSSYLRKDTDDTMSANFTIGQPNLSGSKTLTIYGRNNDTTPALTIYGVASATTRYTTKIYRDATALQLTSALAVDGDITATGNITAGSPSDRRLKRGIETIGIGEAAGILSALRPVRYQWNDKAGELGHLSGVSRGFLADEYNDIIPNATRKIWGEYDAIDYLQVIPYLVAGWQEQNLRIRTLEGEIAALREDNKLLRRAVL